MSEMKSDKLIFGDKTLSALMEDIYTTASMKRRQLEAMIIELRKLIKSTKDAEMISPIIKEFFDVAVKNDEQVIKIATIAQRILLAEMKEEGQDGLISDEEREALLQQMEDIVDEADGLLNKTDGE